MEVDKEAVSLSRVYSYYYNCTCPYSRYLSILFLNILTLVACTRYVDNFFHTLMVIWENEFF